ncbi:MAG: heme o synthase [Kiritimatiellae bacterium]|jgi:protoheme IX farnesyltransferase|nr:heme o synthase [Kiritimatiellia bacterium]
MTKFHSYLNLCKLGIVRMVGVTAAFSYILAAPDVEGYGWMRLIAALIGIMGAAAGSAVLNNVIERDLDARMERTRNRELPQGRILPEHALSFGLLLTLGSVGWLIWSVNLLTAFLVLSTAFLYVVVYTPLKTRTWLNTTIGAIPGAMPTLCGWSAAMNNLDFGAWVMFAILFAWQHPHFYAIAWIYRDDYEKAGYKMLSVVDKNGARLFMQVLLFSLLLLAVSLIPTLIEMAGWVYFAGALLLGIYVMIASFQFVARHTRKDARRLLYSTIVYLPALLLVIMADLAVLRYF